MLFLITAGVSGPSGTIRVVDRSHAAEYIVMYIPSLVDGGDIYAARATIRRSGNLVRMWDMWDFKTAQVAAGKPFISFKQQNEYNCIDQRIRTLSVTGFSGAYG